MARKPRIHYKGALYHVICRGNNRAYIFEKEDEKKKYLEILRKYKKRYAYKLYAFCIMGNHAHLLVEVDETPLSKIMQGVQQVYTYYYNKKNNRSGHVFEQRYKAILCNKDTYLLSLIRYIHQNPVRAGTNEGLHYPFSSHKNYMNHNDDFADISFPLSLFGDRLNKQLERYKDFMGIEESTIQELEEAAYIDDIEKEYHEEEIGTYSLDDIVDTVCAYYNLTREEISFKVRTKQLVHARKMIVMLAKKYSDVSNKALSELLNLSQPTISNIIASQALEGESRKEMNEIDHLINLK